VLEYPKEFPAKMACSGERDARAKVSGAGASGAGDSGSGNTEHIPKMMSDKMQSYLVTSRDHGTNFDIG
jgi:hypothetical protein